MVESILQKIRKTSNYTLLEYVTVFGADVMDKYYEMQFMKKEQSIRISDKPNMEEYIERNLQRLILIMTTSGSF